MPHVDLFGPHPTEFSTHLQTAGYTFTEHRAYAEYNLPYDHPPAAIAVYGNDTALESVEAIARLLKTETILLLFAPSPALLKAVQDATGSLLKLTEVELAANGSPLIVHKFHGLDRYHFILGVSLTQPDSKAANNTDLIGKAIAFASDPPTGGDHLSPPIGTNYCKSESVTLNTLSEPEGHWTMDIYVYVANAKPTDPNWKANGGKVFTVIKHSGTLSKIPTYWDFYVKGESGGVKYHDYQPKQETSTVGNDYNYNIDYDETYKLFKDMGENKFDFDATSKDQWHLAGLKQKYEWLEAAKKLHFWFTDTSSHPVSFYALSVFTSDLVKTKFSFSVETVRGDPVMKPGSCEFDPKTFK